MKLVNFFVKDPCIGWCHASHIKLNLDRFYSCTDEFAEEFCKCGSFRLFRKEVKRIGKACIVNLTLESMYAIEHPDSNQAHYYAEAVLVDE